MTRRCRRPTCPLEPSTPPTVIARPRASATSGCGGAPTARLPRSYRAAFVEATGELYVMQHEGMRGGGRVQVLGRFDSFAELHRVVAGWEDVCGEPGSIDWLLARVGRVLPPTPPDAADPAPEGPRAGTLPVEMSLSGLLRAVMGAAARRPLVVGLAVGLLAVAGGVLALRLKPTAATDTLVGPRERELRRHRAPAPALRRRGGLRARPRAGDAAHADLRHPARAGPGGLHLGQRARGPGAAGRQGRAVRAAGGAASRPRSSSGRAPSSTRPSGRSRTSSAPSPRPATRRPGARPRRRGRWPAPSTRRPAQVRRYGEQAKQLVSPSSPRTSSPWRSSTGSARRPSSTTRTFVSQIVFDDTKGPGVPKGRFAYIFPNKSSALIQVRFRPDLSESQRDRAIDARAPGRRDARLEAAQRQGHLRRHRRAGGRQRPDAARSATR